MKRKKNGAGPARGKAGPLRWKTRLLLACAIIAGILILFATGVRVYAAVTLPAAPSDWNREQIAAIQKAYGEQKKSFFDTGDPDNMEGFSIAVFGDNHNSVQTFGILTGMINAENAALDKEIKNLKGQLAAARADSGRAEADRNAAVLSLEKKINETIKRKVLFAVANGDLTISGNDVQYRMFMKQVKKLGVPFVTNPGNHDAAAAPDDAYQKVFGPRYYSFAVGNSDFIMLDDANQKRVEPGQMKWFEEELKKSEPYRYCFVFMHVPAFRGERDERDKDSRIPWKEYLADRKNADEIKKLCMDYEVDTLFGSHLHTFDFDIWDIEGPPVDESTMQRRTDSDVVWSFVTGGAGAQLWKTYDARAVYNYYIGNVNGQFQVADTGQTATMLAFDRRNVKSNNGESHYLVEKIWTYAFTDIYNNYLWEMLVLVPVFVVSLVLYTILIRRRKRAGEETPDQPHLYDTPKPPRG